MKKKNNKIKNYSRIKMISDKYIDDGIKSGDIGCIIEVYDDEFCEVEFSYEDGTDWALQAISNKEFVVID